MHFLRRRRHFSGGELTRNWVLLTNLRMNKICFTLDDNIEQQESNSLMKLRSLVMFMEAGVHHICHATFKLYSFIYFVNQLRSVLPSSYVNRCFCSVAPWEFPRFLLSGCGWILPHKGAFVNSSYRAFGYLD